MQGERVEDWHGPAEWTMHSDTILSDIVPCMQFHVDNLSSAHIYLRLRDDDTWDKIPQDLLRDCAQLTKANSIDGDFPPASSSPLPSLCDGMSNGCRQEMPC